MTNGIERWQAPLSKRLENFPFTDIFFSGQQSRVCNARARANRGNKRIGKGRYAHKISKIMWTRWRKLYQRSLLVVRQRYFSQFVEVRSDKHNRYCVATVTLNRSPVNSFNIAFTGELTRALKEIEKSEKVGRFNTQI